MNNTTIKATVVGDITIDAPRRGGVSALVSVKVGQMESKVGFRYELLADGNRVVRRDAGGNIDASAKAFGLEVDWSEVIAAFETKAIAALAERDVARRRAYEAQWDNSWAHNFLIEARVSAAVIKAGMVFDYSQTREQFVASERIWFDGPSVKVTYRGQTKAIWREDGEFRAEVGGRTRRYRKIASIIRAIKEDVDNQIGRAEREAQHKAAMSAKYAEVKRALGAQGFGEVTAQYGGGYSIALPGSYNFFQFNYQRDDFGGMWTLKDSYTALTLGEFISILKTLHSAAQRAVNTARARREREAATRS